MREHFAQQHDGGGDVFEKMGAGVGVAEFAVGAEGLHEALHGAEVVEGSEVRRIFHACGGEVVREERVALGGGEAHVGVEQEGGEVVLREAGAEALEINERGLAVADHHVLALEIAVHEAARFGGELGGDFAEARAVHLRGDVGGAHFEVPAEAVLDEVVLLPFVERGVEGRLERRSVAGEVCFRVQECGLFEGEFVEAAALRPGGVAKGEEVFAADVFHDHDALDGIVHEDGRHADSGAGEKARDVGVAGIVGAIEGVADEDARAVAGGRFRMSAEAPEFAA